MPLLNDVYMTASGYNYHSAGRVFDPFRTYEPDLTGCLIAWMLDLASGYLTGVN